MKANELRIRNYIQDSNGAIYYVSNLSLDIDDEYNELIGAVLIGKTSNEVLREERELFWHPIPLSEEWLIKFGFENQKSDIPTFWRSGWIINKDASGNWFVVKGEKVILKYVHQLQNLYFCLTGEELTIKEPIKE